MAEQLAKRETREMTNGGRDLQRQKANLETVFRSWDRERLQLYASDLTEAIIAERKKFQELSNRLKETVTMYNLSTAISSTLNLDEVLRTLYEQTRLLIDAASFLIAIYDEESDDLSFSLIFHQGRPLRPFTLKAAEDPGLTSRVLRGKQPLLIRDWATAPEAKGAEPVPAGTLPRSWLGVPIITGEQAIGVAVVQSDMPGAFGERDKQSLLTNANQAAFAIGHARFYESSTRRARELATLAEVSRTLSSTLDLEEVLTLIMQRVNAVLGVEAGSILLIDEATGELVFETALGEKSEEVKPIRLKMGEGIAGHVALTGEPLMIANVQEDHRHSRVVDVSTDFLTRTLLCVPLIVRGKVIGVLEVMNKVKGDFTSADLNLLTSIAAYAAIAIENARLYRNVLAERDRVIIAQEEVRRQLARDLHDGPTQLVAAMLMNLDFVKAALLRDPSQIGREIDNLVDLGQRATHQMRTLLFELRPLVLESHGLVAALKVFLERRQKDENTALHLELQTDQPGNQFIRPDYRVEAALFAVVQEAVNNALKHAEAEDIWVRLNQSARGLLVLVEDNGRGFDVAATNANYEQRCSMGMVNMRERAELASGHLKLESAPGKGTKVAVWVPPEKIAEP
jgi:signal transduction histidine kinase